MPALSFNNKEMRHEQNSTTHYTHDSSALSEAIQMQIQTAKITPLTVQQYAEISEDIYDEIERVDCGEMIAAKCIKHPKYGDIILVASTTHACCLMIHY
jgi:hypothetical protein